MLEEVCRALVSHTHSSADPAQQRPVTQLWERLLGGPLAVLLQQPSSSSFCAQACSILATIGDRYLQLVAPPCQLFAFTVMLGLCREETVPTSVTVSASPPQPTKGVMIIYFSWMWFIGQCSASVGSVCFLQELQRGITNMSTSMPYYSPWFSA